MSITTETAYHNSLTFANFQYLANSENAKLAMCISFRSDGSAHLLTVKQLTKEHSISLLTVVLEQLKNAEADHVTNFKI